MYLVSIYCWENCSSRVALGTGGPGRVAGLAPAPHPGHVSQDQRLWKSFSTVHEGVLTALGAHSHPQRELLPHQALWEGQNSTQRHNHCCRCFANTTFSHPKYAFTEPAANIYFNRFLLAVLHLCSLGECGNSQAHKGSHMMRISPMNLSNELK